jgi:hypothetical protein
MLPLPGGTPCLQHRPQHTCPACAARAAWRRRARLRAFVLTRGCDEFIDHQGSMLAWAVRVLSGSMSRNFAAADRHTYAWWHSRQDQETI